MKNFCKTVLATSILISGTSFAAEADRFNVELYGKLGGTVGESDTSIFSDRVEDGFSMYEDTKIGLNLGYKFNKQLSVYGEIKSDFQGQDLDIRLQELYVKGELGKFNAELGRFRTPVYMNSEIQDNDFLLKTYRATTLFSTDQSALETTDGISVGFENKLGFGDVELNALYGVAKDREFKSYNSLTDDSEKFDVESSGTYQVEGLVKTKFGKFRVAYLGAELSDDTVAGLKDQDFSSVSMGYAYDSGALFVEGEYALETLGNNDELEYDKYRVLAGYQVMKFTPYVSYSALLFDDNSSADTDAIEAGVSYDFHKNIKFKAAAERFDNGTDDEMIYSFGVAAKI